MKGNYYPFADGSAGFAMAMVTLTLYAIYLLAGYADRRFAEADAIAGKHLCRKDLA